MVESVELAGVEGRLERRVTLHDACHASEAADEQGGLVLDRLEEGGCFDLRFAAEFGECGGPGDAGFGVAGTGHAPVEVAHHVGTGTQCLAEVVEAAGERLTRGSLEAAQRGERLAGGWLDLVHVVVASTFGVGVSESLVGLEALGDGRVHLRAADVLVAVEEARDVTAGLRGAGFLEDELAVVGRGALVVLSQEREW